MTDLKNDIDEILSRSVSEVIDKEHLKKRLESGEVLRIKLGMDPTSPHVHIGRMVTLLKLRDFQKLGHKIILLVGNATGVIGDTSDKDAERPMLTHDSVAQNMKAYVAQVAKVLDMDKVEVVYNADWLDKLGFKEIGELAGAFSVHEFIQRENIKKRLDAGKRVSLREVLYPLMQGYDSVHLRADVEVGGTDQRFNMLAGRTLQPQFEQTPQDVIMMELIMGTDGRKMSSSWGNTINLTDSARDVFGKIMSIPDEMTVSYFTHCTRIPMDNVAQIEKDLANGNLHPRDAKIRLAKKLVQMLYDLGSADAEEQYFINTFSKGTVPTDVAEVEVANGVLLVDVLAQIGLATSKGDARRKMVQGGVRIDNKKVIDITTVLTKEHENSILKVGKKDFRKLIVF